MIEWLGAMATWMAGLPGWLGLLLAQAGGAPTTVEIKPLPQAAPQGNYVLDGIIIAVLFAATLFVVCRSSRRL